MEDIKFKKAADNSDYFTAVDGRFMITADRAPSGHIRGWRIRDYKNTKNDGLYSLTRAALRVKIATILSSELPEEKKLAIEAEIKWILHCCRDTMRIRFHSPHLSAKEKEDRNICDPSKVSFQTQSADYGEAYGVLRALKALGYGDFGAVNDASTLSGWMARLEKEVLKEEGFKGDGKCEWCFNRYRRDDARPHGLASPCG